MYLFLILLIAVFFGGAFYAYRIPFHVSKKDRNKKADLSGPKYDPYREQMRQLYRDLAERPCEYVSIKTFDGLTLSGRYYHTADGAPLDIGFHGYRSSPFTDFCGGSQLSFRMGHNLLLVDQRAHGKSEGRVISFGIRERQDLLCWVNYAVDRFGTDSKIFLYGVSMGGATVLMASELELPKNVKGIIADCPYSSPGDIILSVGRQQGYPPKLIWPFVILGGRIYGGFDVRSVTAADAVKNTKVPILILHGADDAFVPAFMSKSIADANPKKIQYHTFPGADHAMSYLVDTPRYHNLVTEFVNTVL